MSASETCLFHEILAKIIVFLTDCTSLGCMFSVRGEFRRLMSKRTNQKKESKERESYKYIDIDLRKLAVSRQTTIARMTIELLLCVRVFEKYVVCSRPNR